ncbi:MAG: HDIG domain-containing protein [Oligoflexia bacterium]|nr:HDIG domain-containing protein [Oligoflexia bacterium]
MPDRNNGSENSGSRFEKLSKSVLQSDHPVFEKIKKELPSMGSKIAKKQSPFVALFLKWNHLYNLKTIGIAALVATVLSFFIYRQITDPFLDYKLGEVANRHLVAPRTLEMIDEETTDAKRMSAVDSVLTVYDYDRRLPYELKRKINKAFRKMRDHYQPIIVLASKRGASTDLSSNELFIQAKRAFSEEIEIEISDAQFDAFLRMRFPERLERMLIHFLTEANLYLIINDRDELKDDLAKGIWLNRIDTGDKKSEGLFQNISSIIDLSNARSNLEAKAKRFLHSPYNKAYQPYETRILAVTKKLLSQNLFLNRIETEKRRSEVMSQIKPVIVRINKGETIIRYKETINKRHLAILQQMESASQNDSTKVQFFFTAVFLFILIYSLTSFLSGGVTNFNPNYRDLSAFCFLLISTILLIKGILYVATEALIEKFPHIPFDFYYFIVPVSTGAVILRILMDKVPTLIFSMVLSVIGGILLERNFFYGSYIFITCIAASNFTKHIKTRSVVYKAGLITGLINIALITCIVVNTRNAASLQMLSEDIGWITWAGFLSGFFMSLIVVGLVPLIELISDRTSDLRLLELANMNHPLLRDLMVKAPGTYHHSIVIGSLVEAAAESIGANPLLARVMAYYHDVGKMERPLYFIENQGGGYNRHDSLQPHMSAMIIRDHVKKGQELGRKHKLPQPLIDAMSEHHGSSTIWYFYNKAKSQSDDPEAVLESDYKYDGQKPQTKETALVMLGDVVEAATRSVPDPTPLRLSGVVKNILNKYFAEGQLSDCDLTLRELDLIAKSFLEVLLGIYHARIEYGVPSLKDSARKKHANHDNRQNQKASGIK